jgi:hypothetical protein
MTIAKSKNPAESANSAVRLRVRSRSQPKATGDRILATAPAAFIGALEEPA